MQRMLSVFFLGELVLAKLHHQDIHTLVSDTIAMRVSAQRSMALKWETVEQAMHRDMCNGQKVKQISE